MEVVLASSSPRRREILKLIGLKDFEVIPPQVGEPPIRTPSDVVKNALLKGKAVLKKLPKKGEWLVVASDTAVFVDGRFFGKPSDVGEARRMLKTLSGRWHTVYTSINVFHRKDGVMKKVSDLDRALVKFKRLSDREIDWYISTGEPMDKAGAYGIQGYGAIFVERIKGDYFTVMGLSPHRLYEALVRLLGREKALKLLGR